MRIFHKSELELAARRIGYFIYNTPLIRNSQLDKISGEVLFLKCENLQKTHSFKARGALHAVLSLFDKEAAAGVATHSSGNHGRALAWAASIRNIPAHIVVPEDAPAIKVEGIQAEGGIVHFCAPNLESREKKLREICAETHAYFVPPYDDEYVILGQSSCAREIFARQKKLDYLLVPVGGGGLLSGSILAGQHFSPNTKIYGCEPEMANDAYLSLQEGRIIPQKDPKTIADGLRTSLGRRNFEIIREGVCDILTVSEREITDAWHYAARELKLVIEPSSAVPLAVFIKYKEIFRGKSGALIVSGGNTDQLRMST